MRFIVKVGTKGRVTIPVKIRRALNIDRNSVLEVRLSDDNSIIIRKVI